MIKKIQPFHSVLCMCEKNTGAYKHFNIPMFHTDSGTMFE